MSAKAQIVFTAKDETVAAFKSVQNSLGTLSRSASALIPALGGIGAALSVGSFAAAVNDAIKFAGSLDDMAERTGATVESLSALSDVAKIGGHDLGMVEASVIKLNKALHGSDDESKGAAKAIAALGLSVDDLRKKDPAQAMLDVAKALNEFADGGGKSALAMEVLGKAGAQALPFLKDLADQGEQVTKVTAEQAAQAEQYEKSMARLSLAISSTSRAMALEFLPVLSRMSGELAAATQAAGGFFNYFATAATVNPLKSVEENIRAIGAEAAALEDKVSIGRGSKKDEEQLGKLNEKLKVLRAIDDVRKKQLADGLGIGDIEKKKSLDGFVSSAEDKPKRGGGGTKSQIDEALRLIQSLDEQIALKSADAESTDKMTAAEAQAVKVRYQLEAGTLKATDAQRQTIFARLESLSVLEKELLKQKEFADALSKQEESNVKARQSMIEQAQAAEEAADMFGLNAAQISVIEQARLADAIAIAKQNGASEEQIAYLEEELRLRGQLSDSLIKVETKRNDQKDAEDAIKSLDEMGEFAKQAAKNMQDAMADFFIDPTKGGIQSIAETFGQTIQKMIAQAGAAQLGKILFGDMDKTGNLGGLVGSIPWAEIFSFADGGIMTSAGAVPLKKYATGGIANSPQFAYFGEGETPEAFVPLPDGRRIPVQMAGGGSGKTFVQNNTFNGNVDRQQAKYSATYIARKTGRIVAAGAAHG